MKRLSATDAARGFADMLDAVERGETFVVLRNGRPVARVSPAEGAPGAAVKDVLRAHKPDPSWNRELQELRSALRIEDRRWSD